MSAEERDGLAIAAGEAEGVAERGAVDELAGLFVVAGKVGPEGETGSALNEETGERQAEVVELGDGVEDGGLASGFGWGVHVRAAIEEEARDVGFAEFGGDVEKGGSGEEKAAGSGTAEVESGEAAMDELGIGIKKSGEPIEAAAEDGEDSGNIVARARAVLEEQVNASFQAGGGARIGPDEVVQSVADGGVGVRAVIEQPFKGGRIHALAWGKDDGEARVPQRVDVRAVGEEEVHHRDAIFVESGAHEGSVATLVDVRSVLDHPSGDGQAGWCGRLKRDAAFRGPGEGAVVAIAHGGLVERRVGRHEGLDAIEIVRVDGLLE